MPTEPTKEEIQSLFKDLEFDNIERNSRDRELEDIFLKGEFIGKLYQAVNDQVPQSTQRKLLLNVCRNAIIDKAVLLTMLPDIKVDPPRQLPMEDSLFWQSMMTDMIRHYWWESVWEMDERIRAIAFWFALKGRVALQLFPNPDTGTIELFVRDPSTFYCAVSGAGHGYHTGIDENVATPSDGGQGGFKYGPGGYLYNAKGRDILKTFPHADVGNDTKTHQVIEYWDENFYIPLIDSEHVPNGKGGVLGIEHGLGFFPNIYIQDVYVPGRIDATTTIYHSIMMGENLNDLILMDTEERRERLGALTVVENPIQVPKNLAAGRNAVVQVGPGGDVRFVSRLGNQNPSDMGSHIEAIKQMWSMSAKTSMARQGELPSSGPWLSKGIQTAATAAIGGDVLEARQNIAYGIERIDAYAFAMGHKMFPGRKQTMTVHSSAGDEAMTFMFRDLPKHFRHKLEVFPLANDIPTTVVTFLQLEGAKIVSKRTVREKIPGIDAAQETIRIQEEQQAELEQMMAAQGMAQQQQGGPEEVEGDAYAMEKGAMRPTGMMP